jgi:hypothetical protein
LISIFLTSPYWSTQRGLPRGLIHLSAVGLFSALSVRPTAGRARLGGKKESTLKNIAALLSTGDILLDMDVASKSQLICVFQGIVDAVSG